MIKNIMITSLIVLFGVLLTNDQLVNAQMDAMMDGGNNDNEAALEDHGESIETVIQDLLTQYNVDTIQELNCEKVSDEEYERLGDAVMEQQHPGEAHEAMDEMMGGEGSETLRQMHINMGSAYLGCGGSYGPGMMGSGMMGMMGYKDNLKNNNYFYGGSPMMGFGGGMMGGYSIFAGSTWIALMAFLLSGVYFFIKRANKK